MPRYEQLDPYETTTRPGELNQDAVAFYEDNPDGRYEGGLSGEVMGQLCDDGTVHIFNGAHRREAALNMDRPLVVLVYGLDEQLPEYVGGCAVVVLALVGGAGALGWAALELIGRVSGA